MSTKRFLYEKYGRTDLKGFRYIVYILDNYTYVDNLVNIEKEIAEKVNSNARAIERNIRHYVNTVSKGTTVKQFLNNLLLEYSEDDIRI